MAEMLELLLRILIYASIGIIPIVYNYYFVKGRVETLRKTYLTKLKKYEPILPLVEREIHGPQFVASTSTISTQVSTGVGSTLSFTSTPSSSSQSREGSGSFEPYVITTHIVTPVPEAEAKSGSGGEAMPYVVLVVNPQTLRNPEALMAILSSVENVLPGGVARVEGGYEGKRWS